MNRPRPPFRTAILALAAVLVAPWAVSAAKANGDGAPTPTTTTGQPMVKGGTAGPGAAPGGDPVARGRFLAEVLGCVDCHTPRTRDGKREPALLMAGHRAGDPVPPAWTEAHGTQGIGMLVSTAGTAYSGPWGITYARNLTPDPVTGIGNWNEEAFVYILREGTLKPPMPNLLYGNLSDDDLKAIFAWLRTLPAVKNLVPFRTLAPPRLPEGQR